MYPVHSVFITGFQVFNRNNFSSLDLFTLRLVPALHRCAIYRRQILLKFKIYYLSGFRNGFFGEKHDKLNWIKWLKDHWMMIGTIFRFCYSIFEGQVGWPWCLRLDYSLLLRNSGSARTQYRFIWLSNRGNFLLNKIPSQPSRKGTLSHVPYMWYLFFKL